MLSLYQKEIIELMVRQEYLLADLYTLFKEEFPEHSEVWNDLAKEEKKHAVWLKQLFDAGEKGIVLFDEGKIKTSTMKTYIQHLEQIIARAEKKELNLAQAVSFAIDFEQSLIEKNVFTHFDTTSEKARMILLRLILETENHIRKIEPLRSCGFNSPEEGPDSIL
jgi:rubrerythrin